MFKKTRFILFIALTINLLIIGAACSNTANDEETIAITETASLAPTPQPTMVTEEGQFLKKITEILKENYNFKECETTNEDLNQSDDFRAVIAYEDLAQSNLRVTIYEYNKKEAFPCNAYSGTIIENCVDAGKTNKAFTNYKERYATKKNRKYSTIKGVDLVSVESVDFYGNLRSANARYQFYIMDQDSAYMLYIENMDDDYDFDSFDEKTKIFFDTYYKLMKPNPDYQESFSDSNEEQIDQSFGSDAVELLTKKYQDLWNTPNQIWINSQNHASIIFDKSSSPQSKNLYDLDYQSELSFKVNPDKNDPLFYLVFETAPIDKPAEFQVQLFYTKEDMQKRINSIQTICTNESDPILIDYNQDGYFDLNHDWLWSPEKKQFIKTTKRMYANYEDFFNEKTIKDYTFYQDDKIELDEDFKIIFSKIVQLHPNENPYIIENKLLASKADKYGGIDYAIYCISIKDAKTKELIDEYYYTTDIITHVALSFEDINFDGYLDIGFANYNYRNGTDGFILWNPAMKQLTEKYVFSNLSIDTEKELLTEWLRDSAGEGSYTMHKWFGDYLITVRKINYGYVVNSHVYIDELVKPNARFTNKIVNLVNISDREIDEWIDYFFNEPFSYKQ